ncbi:unnamed protein product, partial [Rotaria sordida]
MLSIVNEIITNTYSALTVTHEQRYVCDALQAIDNTDRFALLNGEDTLEVRDDETQVEI